MGGSIRGMGENGNGGKTLTKGEKEGCLGESPESFDVDDT